MRNGANKGVRMTIEDAVSSTRSGRSIARKAGIGLITGVAALSLAGCSSGETFIDGWWDNGDPILVPLKASLFDEEGTPLCATPTAFGQVETRSRAFGETGGVINSFLFEITNPETDPDTGETAQERKKLAVLQDSPGAMYQLTFPAFDTEHGITDSSGMRAIKTELQEHLPDLLTEGLVTDYVKVDDQWIDGPGGHFTVRRADDPQGYIDENNINTTFNGIQNTYFIATNDEGVEYLLVRSKETGLSTLMRSGEEDQLLDESTESFIRYNIENDVTGVNPDATITLVNDQCLPDGSAQVARYWVYDYELLNGEEQGPVVLE
jgi:hypothetical protein